MPYTFGIDIRPKALRAVRLFNPESPGWIPVVIHTGFYLGITSAFSTFLVINVEFAGCANSLPCCFQIIWNITDFQSCSDGFFNKFIHIRKAILRLFFVLQLDPQLFAKMVIPVKQSALSSFFSQETILSKITTESSQSEALKAVKAL